MSQDEGDLGACRMYLYGFDYRCPEQATVESHVACVHEHVRTVALCAGCQKDALRRPEDYFCRPCWDADGHLCPMVASPRVPLGHDA